jgi:hypothetical protein
LLQIGLEKPANLWEFSHMTKSTADERRRVIISTAKPGETFLVDDSIGDVIILTRVRKGRPQIPYNPHLYDDVDVERTRLEEAMARVNVGALERDRE